MHTHKTPENQCVAPAPHVVDDAVGVPQTNWYVAIVNHNAETSVANKLTALGLEAFAATQPQTRIYSNGRRHLINRIVIGSIVFVRCTETQRRQIVTLPYILRFLSDKASSTSPVATIPHPQIQMLRFMLGQAQTPVQLAPPNYSVGQQVQVIRGSLQNLQGTIIRLPNGRGELTISLGALGGAKCEIPLADTQPLPSR